ncbi:hypothetical protein ASG22_17765 [Chryseobacterium sp. Leaf405]|uniref:hypothetical protein n=1 Tax=Chryseobacterium sp. Leaf405 TaxID=1736367 RepID=UPI0006F47173|nr:hypothetical protein [Chryseobacterium sp. Leaf405]KQT33069.1 hypothetical protein ASG22_17765 [Chryseobacterium sp. Leaf405]
MLLRTFISFCVFVSMITVNAQDIEWIPFKWTGDTISGKYFEKSAIVIPLKIDNIPASFNMQFDLGAVRTVIYGNSIQPYLDAYPDLKSKIDTSKTFLIQGVNNPMFVNTTLKMGTTSFKGVDVGYYKNYGSTISKESMLVDTEKHIGTLGPDMFQNKILIIDYPNKRIGVCEVLPKQYESATFQPFKSDDGRPKIPLNINGKSQDVMFDTGSSLFTLTATKKDALEASTPKIVDSLSVSSWGKMLTYYGVKTKKPIKFGNKVLNGSLVYYDEKETFQDFYKFAKIWGLTGNVFFLNNTVIIDYKKKIFGVL